MYFYAIFCSSTIAMVQQFHSASIDSNKSTFQARLYRFRMEKHCSRPSSLLSPPFSAEECTIECTVHHMKKHRATTTTNKHLIVDDYSSCSARLPKFIFTSLNERKTFFPSKWKIRRGTSKADVENARASRNPAKNLFLSQKESLDTPERKSLCGPRKKRSSFCSLLPGGGVCSPLPSRGLLLAPTRRRCFPKRNETFSL